ncbi:MAG: hypothetical protein JW995_09280 [Melioribacteraceae bacterium]|nr:hypothetical protein [Melioribacteraceae bacterium]
MKMRAEINLVKIILMVLYLFSTVNISAQLLPENYKLDSISLAKSQSSTPLSNSINDLLVDDNGIIWLATSRGLSRSTDNGANWTNYYNNQDFDDNSVVTLGQYEGVIWTASGYREDGIDYGAGLRYSTDSGETWVFIDQPEDDINSTTISYGNNVLDHEPVATNGQNITWDIGFTKNTVWTASYGGGVRKSTDNGSTWEKVVLPPDTLDSIKPTDQLSFQLKPRAGSEGSYNHTAFSIIGIDDSTLYIGTAGGINKSTDNGISWVKFSHTNQSNPISGNFITALDYDKATGTVWASTWKAEGISEFWGVSASGNSGESWNVYLPGERAHNFGFKYFGSEPDYENSHIFVATDNGIFRSGDEGVSWISPPVIKDTHTNIVLSTSSYNAVDSKQMTDNTTDIWIGSEDGVVKLNESSGFWNGVWTVYLASSQQGSIDETYAFPNPFSPNFEEVKIKYSFHENPAQVTIRIFDFGMNLVKTLLQNASRGGSNEQFEFWDGRDENGNVVPNGVYFYRLDINDQEPLFGKIMVLK